MSATTWKTRSKFFAGSYLRMIIAHHITPNLSIRTSSSLYQS